jgi:hypothetical protein
MNIDFSIIQVIVYAGFLLTVINCYFNMKLKLNTQFAKVVQLLNYYLAIHFVFIGLIEAFFIDGKYLDSIAPFSLLYGTFLYFANYLTRNEKITVKKVLPHVVIPAIFWIWFIFLLLTGNYTDTILVHTRRPVAIVTLLGYIFTIIFFNKKPMLKQYRFVRPIIIVGSILLLILVIIAIRVFTMKATSNIHGITAVRSIIYISMLGCTLMIFRMQLSMLNLARGKK